MAPATANPGSNFLLIAYCVAFGDPMVIPIPLKVLPINAPPTNSPVNSAAIAAETSPV